MDLTNDTEVCKLQSLRQRSAHALVQVQEVYELLSEHYVEDDEQMFRFNYSRMFFSWYDDLIYGLYLG
jgi:Myristoyl-CoA:protein N-myristoyltransferase, N-terminal domain